MISLFCDFVLAICWFQVVSTTAANEVGHESDPPSPHWILQRKSFYTDPIQLRRGQVANRIRNFTIPSKQIAIHSFEIDIVERSSNAHDGAYVPVPLSDGYLHHLVLIPKTYRDGFRIESGAESRGTHYRFSYPHGMVTQEGEDELLAYIHIMNNRGYSQPGAFHCLECPCGESDYDKDGILKLDENSEDVLPSWGLCNQALLSNGNTACSNTTYLGGMRCCTDQRFCIENNEGSDESDEYILRVTLEYTTVDDDSQDDLVPVKFATCCDATGSIEKHSGNFEYDIPQLCEPNDSLTEDCIHELTTVQFLNELGEDGETDHTDDRWIDLVYMAGHLHVGGLEISFYHHETDELLCTSQPRYGTGMPTDIGNEAGYLVGMTSCDLSHRMKNNALIRIVSRYDARQAHTGVMGLGLIFFAEVEDDKQEEIVEDVLGGLLSIVVGVLLLIGVPALMLRSFFSETQYKEVHLDTDTEEEESDVNRNIEESDVTVSIT